MARGIMHSGDPTKVEVMEKAADGKHQVTGIERWISTDDNGDPIFVPQNGNMVVRLEFKTASGEVGPAYSPTPAELFALVRAFDAPVPKVKPENRMTSRTLALVQQAINDSGKTITVESSNGWVNDVPSAYPDKGIYNVKFAGACRPDRKPDDLSWFETRFGRSLIFEFQIAGDGTGKPTIWDGYPIQWWAKDCFVTMVEDSKGIPQPVEVLTFARTDRGGVPRAALQMQAFIKHYAPSLYDHDWQRDALKSEYGVDEVAQPQYVIVDYAKQDKKLVPIFLSTKTSRKGNVSFGFDLLEDVMETPDYNIDDEDVEEGGGAVHLLDLVKLIEALTPEITVFETFDENNVEFSDDGREWMREYVGGENGPWHRAGLPLENKPALTELTSEQIEAFSRELQAQFGEPSESPDW